MSKESQHKQNNAVMQKHAVVLDAREQVALLRHSAADWAGSHGRTSREWLLFKVSHTRFL